MRPNKKTEILKAATRVIDRHGVTGITFDSVAEEAGITRAGLIYHFPSREILIQSLHEYLATQWEDGMLALVGKPVEETTASERFRAYVEVASKSATRAELLFMLDSSTNPDVTGPWTRILEKWAPPSPSKQSSSEDLTKFVARMAADGLWVYESFYNTPLSPDVRKKVVKELIRIIETAEEK